MKLKNWFDRLINNIHAKKVSRKLKGEILPGTGILVTHWGQQIIFSCSEMTISYSPHRGKTISVKGDEVSLYPARNLEVSYDQKESR